MREGERLRAKELGFDGRAGLDGESAPGKSGVFLKFESFVVRAGASGVENQDTEGVTGPAIVSKEAFQVRLLDADLVVNGSDGPRNGHAGDFAQAGMVGLEAAHHGVDEGGSGGAKIERGDGGAIFGLEKRLPVRGAEEEFIGAVSVVIEKFDAWSGRFRVLLISDGFGADEVAPRIGAEMGSVDAAENTVPIDVIALSAEEEVARFEQRRREARGLRAQRGDGGDAGGNMEHFLVKEI